MCENVNLKIVKQFLQLQNTPHVCVTFYVTEVAARQFDKHEAHTQCDFIE